MLNLSTSTKKAIIAVKLTVGNSVYRDLLNLVILKSVKSLQTAAASLASLKFTCLSVRHLICKKLLALKHKKYFNFLKVLTKCCKITSNKSTAFLSLTFLYYTSLILVCFYNYIDSKCYYKPYMSP
ncbi:uncharacterized protein BDR25DRAFT_320672 [Lindgomyces ingoldianus]|uniref:Uncharacterized protein n=1 Tax=Lindgomyces ingoldianus TaxID=673940 RepID=A0ACB6Q6M7_9PLEO|nr:uncharacterized protein BDR25DRAFT_320672 [Lindgomyces ingoldianus]KAF2462523.1 hypothetical protein BDR25DRAFT_320672 [Lindgomyces ingoldianus]